MSETVTHTRLSNGLLVSLKEIHTSPLISHWVWYRVGSRNERPGTTGISHWVEHMLFKGTPAYPSQLIDRVISREGGIWNAFTYLDWTTFFETMPAETIELAMQLEADRMVNSLFDQEEVAAERTVIISERQGNENEPLFRLGEQMQAMSFMVHSYHHEIIGDLADLETIQRDDLYGHYRRYYVPSNAILAIAGDFETGAMLDQVQRIYEPIPAGQPPAAATRPEPAQHGERRVTVEGPGETIYIQAAYHVPVATHPDFFPLTVLDSLFSGASSLNVFGGSLSNKTSRLYRTLVEKELAVSVDGSLPATIDPYMYTITAIVHPQKSAEDVIRAIDEEIEKAQSSAPSASELARAVKQARALFAYGSESVSNQAFWLGFAEMFASYDWFTTYLDQLAAVTPEDVLRVAQTYLRPQNRILGVYLPTHDGAPLDDAGPDDTLNG